VSHRSRVLTLVCLIGFVISALLIGVVLFARRRALSQAVAAYYTPLSGEADWAGNWEFSELGADPSQAGTERVTIPFEGTDLALRVRRGDYRGYFFVSVDGRPANRLPWDGSNAYLVLTSPDREPEVATIPVAAGLDDGPHEALVAAERGWDQWPLVGWRVSRAPDTTLHHRALAGLLALGVVCLGGMFWWGVRPIGQRVWGPGDAETRGQGDTETRRRSKAWGTGGRKDEAGGRRQEAGGGGRVALVIQHPAARSATLVLMLAALGVFYFSPSLPLMIAGGLVLAALVLLRLDLGLALIAATVPFYLHPRPLFGKAFTLAEILTLLCAFSWGIRQIGRWYARWRKRQEAGGKRQEATGRGHPASSLDVAVVFFLLVAVASLFVAEYRHVALREFRLVVLEPVLVYLMVRTSRLEGRAVWRIVDLFVVGALVVALIGLVQYGLGVNIITAEQGFRRLRSVYGSPNNAALYLGRALPVLLAVALFGTATPRRVAYGVALIPVGLAILLSFSKGALILGVPLSLLALGLLAGRPWSWASVGAVAVAALAAIPLLHTPRFAHLFDVHSGTTFFRLQLWRSSWLMFRDHAWLGVGLDNFLYQYRGRYIMPAAWQEPNLSHPHNALLDYGCRLGLCGVVAGLVLQIGFWRLALPLRHRNGAFVKVAGRHQNGAPVKMTARWPVNPGRTTDGPPASCWHDVRRRTDGRTANVRDVRDGRALALGLMASMVNFVAHGLADTAYFVIDLAFVFFLTLGVMQCLARSETDEP